ncbi:hypothetical protein TUM4438_41600 [Shewanella sairae]|uniref:YjbF family lipoprotein n=1 Tax=Shewanella sairae TaxID=190310 RepID=A0ABQ4PQX3_9GAMM|nr:hypothetical protein [Shewanella sairae]MCL1132354.1 hypothetical protein [Shewanella sairae]GIU51548.1 hypothetical protein TUM4438_41600 [Shewanella sairae]
MKLVVLVLIVCLQGCSSLLTTKQSDNFLLGFADSDVSEFLMDQASYNIDKPGYNILLGSGGDPSYFLYRPALEVEEQVGAPAYNLKRLCQLSNGVLSIIPFSGGVQLHSEENLKRHYLNRAVIEQMSDSTLKYNMLTSYDNASSHSIKKDLIVSSFQRNKLNYYINNNFFYNEISCSKPDGVKWGVSIIPLAIRTDYSGIDELLLYMGVVNY